MATTSHLLAMLLLVLLQTGETGEAPSSPAHVHIRHVLTAVNGPRGGVGFLTILEEEAQIARRHAELAASDLANLEAMQTHMKHVRHAIDPSTEEKGPGRGFGVLRAASSVETHILLAAKSEGKTDNIERHATHVATSARNVVTWSEAILAESEEVLKAETAEAAAPAVQKIAELTGFIVEGHDSDSDGQVSWQEGEGGVAQVRQHAELLAKGEGIAD
ncbi:MAG: hypothetical protein WBM46_09165 [Polyangiales bacterium]